MPQAAVESRHLGLKTADEIADLQEKIALLADALVLDWQRLAVLTEKPAPEALPGAAAPTSVRIAVAKDEAFCFTYAETLDALRDAGAELVLFSPVQDAVLPENIGGLYLPGGYPELYAQALSENKTMRASIRQAVQAGLPTAAECGGFLYLGRSLRMPTVRRGPWQTFCRAMASGWEAGALWLCRNDRQGGQYALLRRRNAAHPRIPPLGFHRKRHCIYGP